MSPSAPFRFAGATAVLTGAASGIGEQLAHGLAARGTHLVLLDRDAAGLETVAGAIRAGHPDLPVRTVVADLAELSALPGVAERIRAEHPRIDLLVNNAGVGLGGTFEQVSAEEFDWLMDINFRAPVVLTRELLPALLAAPGSHLVNLSSLFGLVARPGRWRTPRASTPCAGSPRACATSWRAGWGSPWCTRAGSGPGSPRPPVPRPGCRRSGRGRTGRTSRRC